MGVTAQRLDELFTIDPIAGSMIWRSPPNHHGNLLGREAGTLTRYGYIQVKIDGRLYRRARLIWFYVHGVWPLVDADHRNLVKTDDRIANLREATKTQNQCNIGQRSDNTSGAKGVDWRPAKQRYRARITVGGFTKTVGHFMTLEAAVCARSAMLPALHGEFARVA